MDFNNTGAMRSPFSPRVRQSLSGRRPIGLSSAKKNQSKFNQTVEDLGGDVIYKTPLITLETYGAPLPVMVTEALAFGSSDVSVRLSPCGWCWVVSGRRVLAWPWSAGSESSGPSAARELTLPQTDLAHKSDLVMLFYEDGAQMPSCIGVSPEGIVRYWSSVGQEGAYVDVSCELAGQECDRITSGSRSYAPLVLATTTCTLVLLTPTTVEGRATVTCRTLRPPSGWLGGIGRRVSLMFFGSMPAHVDTKLVGVVVLGEGGLEPGTSGCVALVAGGVGGAGGAASGAAGVGAAGAGGAGPLLQAWRGADLYEHSLRRQLIEAYARPHLGPHGDLSSLEIQALDVRASGDNGLLLLIAAINVARSPEMRYSIAHISLEDLANPRVTSLLSLRSWPIETDESPRFLPLPTYVLLYTSKYIALVSSVGGAAGEKAEYVDVSGEGDRVLGGELCGAALVVSARHGTMRAYPHPHPHPHPQRQGAHRSVCESPMGSPCPSDMYDGNLSLYEIDPHEISAVTTDACGKLKTAFLFHLRRENAACRDIIHQLFPPPPPPPARRGDEADADDDVDNVLDRTVLKIATEMLDDMPAGDPRWKAGGGGGGVRVALGSSAALCVAAQLQDKKRAFTLYMEFLRATRLAQRLGSVSDAEGGGAVRSVAVLGALAERLAAAIALRNLHQGADAHLIDAAIYQVTRDAELEEESDVVAGLASGALAPADVCFRRVTRVRRLLRALCALPAPATPASARLHLPAVRAILNNVMSEMHACRAQWQAAAGAAAAPAQPAAALLPALLDLHKRTIAECSARDPATGAGGAGEWEGSTALAAAILTEAAPLAARHLYRAMRRDTIQPFVDAGQLERAAILAEKFKDFELLIEICINSNDLENLYNYIDKYTNEGMCELTFAWLADRGGRYTGILLRSVAARYSSRFRAWVGGGAGGGGRAGLAALHALCARQHAAAALALQELATEETASCNRMQTMASLAKLCLLAGSESEGGGGAARQLASVERQLALCEQQRAVPRELRLRYGLDADDARVLPPEELVQMYIESGDAPLTEYDYKKALDLTDYIPDMERRDDLRLRVWCASILRSEWGAVGVSAPERDLDRQLFFRLIDLVHVMGGDLELLLPPLEDILTAPELAELVSEPRAHFLIKYGYECLDTRQQSMIDE